MRNGLREHRVEKIERMAHAGEEKAVLIPEIFIYDADRNAGFFCYGIDIGSVKTALGKLVDAGLEYRELCIVVKLFVHSSVLRRIVS